MDGLPVFKKPPTQISGVSQVRIQSGATAPHSKTWPSCEAQFALASWSAALLRRFGSHFVVIFVTIVLLFFATSSTYAAQQISDDRDLKEINLSAWDCLNKPGGTARTPDGI